VQQPRENLAPADMAKIAAAVARFARAWEEQTRRDGEIFASIATSAMRFALCVDTSSCKRYFVR
jgi:hypothetical protein